MFFLVEPVQTQLSDILAQSGAPQEIVASVITCATENAPLIVERALDDPWWAASSALSIWVGISDPQTLMAEAAPVCAEAIDAARPFLETEETTS